MADSNRAVADGLIPGPGPVPRPVVRADSRRARWPISASSARRPGRSRTSARSAPPDVLSGRLGLEVTADGVEELARRDLLPVTGSYKAPRPV